MGDISLIRGGNDTSIKCGSMLKQGKSSFADRWHTIVGNRLIIFRFAFIFQNAALLFMCIYFCRDTRDNPKAKRAPLNSVPLNGAKVNHIGRDTLQILGYKSYTLKYANETEAREWIAAMKKAESFGGELAANAKIIIEVTRSFI